MDEENKVDFSTIIGNLNINTWTDVIHLVTSDLELKSSDPTPQCPEGISLSAVYDEKMKAFYVWTSITPDSVAFIPYESICHIVYSKK